MAAIWATGELWLRVPETIRIDLHGGLPPGVTAKDLSLWLLRLLGPEAGIYRALEFGGPGLASLSIESRMVIPNMMAESGAKNAYLEPDDLVFDWLAERLAHQDRHRRAEPWQERLAAGALYPDPDAALRGAAGRRPGRAGTGRRLSAQPGQRRAAVAGGRHARGPGIPRHLHQRPPGGPGRGGRGADAARMDACGAWPPARGCWSSRHRARCCSDALAAGYIETFLAAGAMLGTPGCGPCMGNHMGIPAPGEVTISSAQPQLPRPHGQPGQRQSTWRSPAVVAASAVLGRIADPRELEGDAPALPIGESPCPAAPAGAGLSRTMRRHNPRRRRLMVKRPFSAGAPGSTAMTSTPT